MKQTKKSINFFLPALKYYQTPHPGGVKAGGTVAVSVTGARCAQNCKHCGGTILKHMRPALTPEVLVEEARRAAQKGARAILVSGGSMANGGVPLSGFKGALQTIKAELGIKVLVHTGLVTPELAGSLAEAGIDLAMLDIIGDDETIRQVCRLNARVEDFAESLRLLTNQGIPTAPHLVLGLHFGTLRGEWRALDLIRNFPVAALVLVGFRPAPGTAMAKSPPLPPETMGEIFIKARSLYPNIPVLLGCERPLGEHRRKTDCLALKAGLDGIAFPSEEVIRLAGEREMEIQFLSDCCALNGLEF